MDEENKIYQLTCLFSPLINSEESDKLIQKIKKEITAQGGSFIGENISASNLAKKRLSYPIDKYQEALFLSLSFVFPTKSINSLIKRVNSEKNILRCLITIKKERKSQAKPVKDDFDFGLVDKIEPLVKKEISQEEEKLSEIKETALRANIFKEEPVQKTDIKKPSKEKVKIEELDKKLEEILNQ